MSEEPLSPGQDAPNDGGREKAVLCPYCGHTQMGGNRCQACRGLFEPLSRKATQAAMGPWYIRDKENPFRPGCSYEVIKRMAEAGRIKPTTVMRGPTTHQFWSIARNVPGVAHLIGYDDALAEVAESALRARNELGLQYPTDEAASRAQKAVERALRGEQAAAVPHADEKPADAGSADLASVDDDLLDDPFGDAELGPDALGGEVDTGSMEHEVLNFAPSEADSPLSAPSVDLAPAPAAASVGPVTWFLIAANIIAAASVAMLFYFTKVAPA